MPSIPFLQPRLVGQRFAEHAIPLEFLADFAALEDMVLEAAKWQYRELHPERSRSPRNFFSGVSLKLTGLEDGSARPIISLVFAGQILFASSQPYFEDARKAIIAAIGAAAAGMAVESHLPEKALRYFDKFGRSLRDGEAIEFTNDAGSQPARLTKESRRRLVLAASSMTEISENVRLYGRVPEANKLSSTFHIQLPDGRKLNAAMGNHQAEVLEAFNAYEDGVRIRVDAIGKFNQADKLQRIESPERISVLENLDVGARLDEFKLLKDGWLNGEGAAPRRDGLDWLAESFEAYAEQVPLPFLYPTINGGVRIEWSLNGRDLSLDIDLITHTAKWHSWTMSTDFEEEEELSLNDQQGWEWVVSAVSQAASDTND